MSNNLKEKIETKFLVFELLVYEDERYYTIRNKKREYLGRIGYFPKWKKWVYSNARHPHVILDQICLKAILDLLEELNKK